MSLHLVTGHAGHEHITPADHGAFYNALLLSGSYVLNSGNNFSASVITNNTIKISDGELIMQGRHVRMKPGEYEEVTIENGAQESTRNDLIVARYVKDGTTGIENVSFVVIKGASVASGPSDPAYIEGNILNGVLTADFPLYRVPLDGLNVGELVPLFEVKDSFDKRIEEIINGTKEVGKAKDADKLDGHGAEYFAPLEALERLTLTRYVGNTEDEINAIYDSIYANVKDGEWFRARVHHNGSHSILEGGMWYLEGYRGTSIFGWEKITNYTANGVRNFARMLYGTTTWSEWVADFTTAGGTIDGNITVFSNEAVKRAMNVKNSLRSAGVRVYENGVVDFYDYTNAKNVFRSTADGTNTFNGTASGNLPLTGGKSFTLEDTANARKAFCGLADGTLYYRHIVDDSNYKEIIVNSTGARFQERISGTLKGYTLHHDGNSAKVVINETAPSDTTALWVY